MPICPFASFEPIPPQLEMESQGRGAIFKKNKVVLHTADGSYQGALDWWEKKHAWGIFSHFFVLKSGRLVQMVDTDFKAVANCTANYSGISVESEDGARPETTPWNDKQLESIVRLMKWVNEVHAVPFRTCASPIDAGFGFHTMWGNTPTLNEWLGAQKICPGVPRITQFYQDLMPAVGFVPGTNAMDEMFARWTSDPRRKSSGRRRPKLTPAKTSTKKKSTPLSKKRVALVGDDLFDRRGPREADPFTRRRGDV